MAWRPVETRWVNSRGWKPPVNHATCKCIRPVVSGLWPLACKPVIRAVNVTSKCRRWLLALALGPGGLRKNGADRRSLVFIAGDFL
jgi:hypothetical protein